MTGKRPSRDKAIFDPVETVQAFAADRRKAASDRYEAAADRIAAQDDRGRARRDRASSRADRDRAASDRAEAVAAIKEFQAKLDDAEDNAEDMLLIGQAQGILMNSRGIDSGAALLVLQKEAAHLQVQLADAARRIASDPGIGDPQ